MTPELENIARSLEDQKEKLLAHMSELEAELENHRDNFNKIESALAALQGAPAKKPRKKQSKPSASKADVEAALMSAKEVNPEATDQELKQIVEETIVSKGFSKSGLGLRLKQLLSTSDHAESSANDTNRLPH